MSDTAPVELPPRDGRIARALDASAELALSADAFLARRAQPEAASVVFALALLYGVANAVDVADSGLGTRQGLGSLSPDWWSYWSRVLVRGLFTSAIGAYWLGPLLLKGRLYLCGARELPLPRVRQVYLWVSAVWAAPTLAIKLAETALYDGPKAASAGTQIGAAWAILLLAWVVLIEYRACVACFPLRPLPAVLWLLVAPALFFIAIILGAMALAMR